MPANIIRVEHLVFEYPGLRALDDVSFTIKAGSITALVGPNGAGKTTLLRCLAGLEQPLLGRIEIDGIDALEHPRECHRRLGYLSDFFGLYDALTVRQCLRFVAESQGIGAPAVDPLVEQTAAQLGLTSRLEMRAGELSRGLRQRLAVGQAIIHSPKVLLLDEPASGLDPEARHTLAGLFRMLRDQGMTLVVSSHILAELEEYSSEMLVLHAGRIIEQKPLGVGSDSGTRMRVELADDSVELRERLMDFDAVQVLEVHPRSAVFLIRGDKMKHHELLRKLLDQGILVCALAEQQENLQDSYLATVRQNETVQTTR
jgi:ABC-2 type transport system ATP-binding protein